MAARPARRCSSARPSSYYWTDERGILTRASREPEGRPSYIEVLSGLVISDIRPAVDSLFDKVVRATLERTITKTEADQQEQVRYRLVDVDAVQG